MSTDETKSNHGNQKNRQADPTRTNVLEGDRLLMAAGHLPVYLLVGGPAIDAIKNTLKREQARNIS
jgi:hypothetical protein